MYILKSKQYPDLYWSEVANKWTYRDSASLFYSEDDASHALHDVGSEELTMLVCVVEKVDDNDIDTSPAIRMGEDKIHCDPECPFLKTKGGIGADCSLLKREVPWYDWHIAICHDLIEEE